MTQRSEAAGTQLPKPQGPPCHSSKATSQNDTALLAPHTAATRDQEGTNGPIPSPCRLACGTEQCHRQHDVMCKHPRWPTCFISSAAQVARASLQYVEKPLESASVNTGFGDLLGPPVTTLFQFFAVPAPFNSPASLQARSSRCPHGRLRLGLQSSGGFQHLLGPLSRVVACADA